MIFIAVDNEYNRANYPNEVNMLYHPANVPPYVNVRALTSAERNERMNYRNFFLAATMEELRHELSDNRPHNTTFRRACIREIINEIQQQ